MPETMAEALTRGWLRLPREARQAIHPLSALTRDGLVNSRLARAYLTPRVRCAHPELGPVLRARAWESRELDQVAEAVAGLLPEVLADGPVATGLRKAFARAGLPTAEHEDTLYGWVVRWTGNRPPSREECDRVIDERFGRGPDSRPPTYAALDTLLGDAAAVAELGEVVSRNWTPRPARPRRPMDAAQRRALDDLLDSDVTCDLNGLWEAYVKTRPWESLLDDPARSGMSAASVPEQPTVTERRQGRGTSLPLPLDRSLRQRLGSAVFQHPETAGEEFRGSSTRDLARREAERMCLPLGLGSDDRRTAFALGIHLAYAVNASTIEERRSPHAGGHRLFRRMEKLIAKVLDKDLFAYSERRPGDWQSPAQLRLENPQFHVVPRLWPRLHTPDVRGESFAPEQYFKLLNSAIRSFVRENGKRDADSDEFRIVPLAGDGPAALATDVPQEHTVSFLDAGAVVVSVFNHRVAHLDFAGHTDAFGLTRWFLTASDQEAVRDWWSRALDACTASLPDGAELPVRPTAAEAREVVRRLHSTDDRPDDDSGEGQ
ncbi:hypothetical protein [Streptomyces sp. NPDC101166]|uniref:hypothetical protein n=1 Tax=Streptomyces sp. NPDC101166 TaxID=3366120 RepID=UPI0038183B47